jgi:hypothetical protein
MIVKLTQEQEKMLEVYKNKYIDIGLNTDRFSFETAKQISDFYYEKICGKKRVPIIIMDSPYSAWLAVCLLSSGQVWTQVEDQVYYQVYYQVCNQVKNQVYNQVCNQVKNQVWNQVEQVRNQVRNQVWNQVENQVWNQYGNK